MPSLACEMLSEMRALAVGLAQHGTVAPQPAGINTHTERANRTQQRQQIFYFFHENSRKAFGKWGIQERPQI